MTPTQQQCDLVQADLEEFPLVADASIVTVGFVLALVKDVTRLRGILAQYDAFRQRRCDWCGSSGEHEDTCSVFWPSGEVR